MGRARLFLPPFALGLLLVACGIDSETSEIAASGGAGKSGGRGGAETGPGGFSGTAGRGGKAGGSSAQGGGAGSAGGPLAGGKSGGGGSGGKAGAPTGGSAGGGGSAAGQAGSGGAGGGIAGKAGSGGASGKAGGAGSTAGFGGAAGQGGSASGTGGKPGGGAGGSGGAAGAPVGGAGATGGIAGAATGGGGSGGGGAGGALGGAAGAGQAGAAQAGGGQGGAAQGGGGVGGTAGAGGAPGPICGDGVIDRNEQCDAGPTGDSGCSAECRITVCAGAGRAAAEETDEKGTIKFCYFIVETAVSWEEAAALCEAKGAILGLLYSAPLRATVSAALPGTGSLWVAGKQTGKKTDEVFIPHRDLGWEWQAPPPVGAFPFFGDPWSDGQPDDDFIPENGQEDCAEARQYDGLALNDLPCGNAQRVLCEIVPFNK